MSVTQRPRHGTGNQGSNPRGGGGDEQQARWGHASPETGAQAKDGGRATFTRVLAAAVLATIGLGVGDSLGGPPPSRSTAVGRRGQHGRVRPVRSDRRARRRPPGRSTQRTAGRHRQRQRPAPCCARSSATSWSFSDYSSCSPSIWARTARRRCRDRRDPRHRRPAHPGELLRRAGPALRSALRPGQQVTVHSGALGGPFASTITDAGLLYTTLITSTCRDPTAQQRTARSPHRTSNRPDARRRPTDRCR